MIVSVSSVKKKIVPVPVDIFRKFLMNTSKSKQKNRIPGR